MHSLKTKAKIKKSKLNHFWSKLALKRCWARAHVAWWKGALSPLQPPILRAEDIKCRHTWSDTNLAGPEQFPDCSLTLATGVAVMLGCSVTTCSGINAASHVDVSQHIHVNGVLVAPALCLELSSWVIFIEEGKMKQNHNVTRTY